MVVDRENILSINKLTETEKELKLIELMNSALDSTSYSDEFTSIMNEFRLSRDDVAKEFLNYNMDVYAHDNEVYKHQAIRLVLHIHNLIAGSWHIERQEVVSEFIKRANPSRAIDLGFGVPARYVREMLTSQAYHLTLCDYDRSALVFANKLLNIWGRDWQDNIDLLCHDMEQAHSCVGDYDLYISLHSIEHVGNPTKCLTEYVNLSQPRSMFLIEIPIGAITPEHNIAWDNTEQARSWIDSTGLRIIKQHVSYVNPSVDLFAEPHGFNYGGYLALCDKK